jgi:hypothetical protein
MGSERHKRTTIFPLRPAGHRRHSFLRRAYLQNNHCTSDAHRPPNFEWARLDCYF